MTIKIYKPQLDWDYLDPQMFFDINGQDYVMLTDPKEYADIVLLNNPAVYNGNYLGKTMLFFEMWHNFENQWDCLIGKHKNNNKNWYTLTNAIGPVTHPSVIFNDFLFNRTKAYYSQFPFKHTTRKWYYQSPYGYILPDSKDATFKRKIYLAPNKNHPERPMKFRPQIVNLLKENFVDIGYIGNVTDDQNLVLHPHGKFPLLKNIQEVESIDTRDTDIDRYSPPHNEYYKNTFISIYGETIEWGDTIAVTEKTYDPLIRGHFILPFSTDGFIKHLKNLGFKFPDFINYDYDNIRDEQSRFNYYTQEVYRLLNFNIEDWKQAWNDNLELIRFNQLMFYEKPYDRVDLLKLFD
jgi:hypothetical protein